MISINPKMPSPKYAIVNRSFRLFRLITIVLWTVSKKLYKEEWKMLEYLAVKVIRDMMVIVGFGLAGSVASQVKYKIRKGGK